MNVGWRADEREALLMGGMKFSKLKTLLLHDRAPVDGDAVLAAEVVVCLGEMLAACRAGGGEEVGCTKEDGGGEKTTKKEGTG